MNYFDNAKIFYTCGVVEKSTDDNKFRQEVEICVRRFNAADCGEVSEFDGERNYEAVKNSDMVLGAYDTSQGRIWIIAESSNAYEYDKITVLFPNEY